MQSMYIFKLSLTALMPLFCRYLLITASIIKCNAEKKVQVLDLEKIKFKKLDFLK